MVETQTNKPAPEFFLDKETLEIKAYQNAHRAWQYVDRLARNKPELSEEIVKEIHSRCMDELLPESATGRYRTCDVGITQASFTPPPYLRVRELMREFISDLNSKVESLKLVGFSREAIDKKIEVVAFAHYTFVRIHPFEDGNGRTARLFADLIAKILGLKPIIIWPFQRENYIKSLERVNRSGNLAYFELFLLRRLRERYERIQEKYSLGKNDQEIYATIQALIKEKSVRTKSQKEEKPLAEIWPFFNLSCFS